jgi:broad specificity phosphatase PhoE
MAQGATRLIFVRHGKQQSTSERSAADRKDPTLSEQGLEQSARRARDLAGELASAEPLLIFSSPMRRALMTAAAAAAALRQPLHVQGACFEFGCAGTAFRGSGKDAILVIDPQAVLLSPSFGPDGEWGYVGSSESESEQEAKQRVRGVVRWLREEVVPQARGGAAVLFAHQTFLDLLLQLLLTGSDDGWTYGLPTHKLAHTGVARVLAHADGRFEKQG